MNNICRNHKIFLPFVIGMMCLFVTKDAYAWSCDWCKGLVDGIVQLATDVALGALGIDNDVNCDVPQPDTSFCMFCPLFKLIFNAASLMAYQSYSAFGQSLAQVVLTFLAVSLALIVIKYVVSMGAKDTAGLMNDVLKKAFLCGVIFTILNNNYYYVLSLTIYPIFNTLTMYMLPFGSSPCSGSEGLLLSGTSGMGSGVGGGLPDVGVKIVCAVQSIEGQINQLFEFGEWAICRGNGPDRWLRVIPNLIYIIDGLLLYLGGIFFMIAYPWVMADAIIQLGIALALLPFAICGYAFGGTRGYLNKIVEWILNAAFVFIFTTLVISVVLDYVSSVLTSALTNNLLADPKEIFADPNKGIAFWGPNMILIMFILAIGYTYLPLVKELASEFSAGSGVGAAQSIGSAATQRMENAAQKVGKTVANAGIDAGKWVGKTAVRNAKAGVRKGIGFAAGAGGINLLGMKFKSRKDGNGNDVLQRKWKNLINGREHNMVSDKYSTTYLKYDKNGNLIHADVETKYDFADKYMIDDNGFVNVGALQTLLNSAAANASDPRLAKDTQDTMLANIAIELAKKQGMQIGKHFKNRRTIRDRRNPFKIIVIQEDYDGKITQFAMDIDSASGRAAVAVKRQNKDGSTEAFLDNGMGKMLIKRDKHGKEVTQTSYHNMAKAGHTDYKDTIEKNKVINKHGQIADDLDPGKGANAENSILFGVDLLEDLNITQLGQTGEDLFVDVFATAASKRKNKFKTSYL